MHVRRGMQHYISLINLSKTVHSYYDFVVKIFIIQVYDLLREGLFLRRTMPNKSFNV